MHPFSLGNHSLPATTAQSGSFLPTHFANSSPWLPNSCPPLPNSCLPLPNTCPNSRLPMPKQLPIIAKQLPTLAQTVVNRCPNSRPLLPKQLPTLAKQLPTIAQKLAHVCPPWDAMLTGSPSRILETFCEALTEWLRVSCPPITPQMVFFASLHLLLYDSHTSNGRRSNIICHATRTHGSWYMSSITTLICLQLHLCMLNLCHAVA